MNAGIQHTVFICLGVLKIEQNYIKQYQNLQFNTKTLFSGYGILWLTGFALKKGAIQDSMSIFITIFIFEFLIL